MLSKCLHLDLRKIKPLLMCIRHSKPIITRIRTVLEAEFPSLDFFKFDNEVPLFLDCVIFLLLRNNFERCAIILLNSWCEHLH
jgi:hypothetical protein